MASRNPRLHGRVEGARDRCAVPGCGEPGEYKAPLEPANFNGPGSWRFLCLDHVREHNSKYNYFDGMSPEEISAAQTPYGGWERSVRAFSPTAGATPAWSDFADPLDAIAARFRHRPRAPRRRASRSPSGARCRCSGSARMPTAMRCAAAIRSWSGATTPTRTAATAATKPACAK